MDLGVAPIGRSSPLALGAADDGGRVRRTPALAPVAPPAAGEIPASPPPEVLEAIDAASRAYRQLHAQGRELRFDLDDAGLRVHVVDLDGNVLRTIPPSEALELATTGRLAP